MNATIILTIFSAGFLGAAGGYAICAPPAGRLRQAERELADARAHLDWWQRSAVNFADRNQTLRRQVAAANNAATPRGW